MITTIIIKWYKYLLNHPIIFVVIFFLILSIIPFLRYHNVIISETDIGYDINPLNSFLRKTFLWDKNFIFGAPIFAVANFYNILNVSLFEINISSFVVKQIWLGFLLFIAGTSMYYFIGVFFGKEKRLLRIISSVTYMYSFFLIRMLIVASTMVIGYVVFPLLLGLYINGFKKEKTYIYYAVLLSLSTIILSNINLTLIVIDVIAISIFLLVYLIMNKNINYLRIIKINILLLTLTLLISAWWIMPLAKNSISNHGYVEEALGVETTEIYNRHSSNLETFRLLGDMGFYGQYKGVPNISFANYYSTSPIIIFGTFLFAILSIFGLFFIRSKSGRLYLLLLLVFFSAMAVGAYPITSTSITGRIYLWCYEHVPLFSIFRNGYKSVAIIAFVYSVLFGCFISSIYAYLKKKFENERKIFHKALPVIFVSLAFGLILLNSFPLWKGKIFDNKKFQTVPSYWYEIGDYLNTQPQDFRVLMFPDSYFGVFKWGSPKGSIANALINRPSIETRGGSWGYKRLTELVYDSFTDKNAFTGMLSIINVNYIVQRNDIDWKYYDIIPPEKIKEMLLARDDLIFENKFGELDLYRVKDNYFLPHIYSSETISYIGNDVESINQALSFNNYPLKNGILFSDFKLDESNNAKLISEKISSVLIAIQANPAKIAEMKLAVDVTTDAKEQKKMQSDLDLYANNLFFKDYKLNIPIKANYKIYLKSDSVLANNKNINIQVADRILQQNTKGTDKDGWKYFAQIELEKGEHLFNLYIGTTVVDAINSGDIVLSAENLTEPIKTPQLEYKQINPTKYIVNVHGASESFPLIFSESFHPGWKIYIQPALATQGTGKFISENNQGTIQNENLNGGKFYDVLFRKPVLDEKHLLINGFANSWWIDVGELEKQGKIAKNVDGTYDFSVYIEFEPQKFFYIGLVISGLTLLACLLYLLANAYHWYTIRKVNRVDRIPPLKKL
ncbi:MAG: alpha-(1-_3)-arabinofuranosyltransferase family protein [Candidatus Magasanikbacteria bacterium]|nr:alpha-(1->3)-arabinofuranosyltransferase family protein [Candidatus Magasanikbacteria bacterium]